MTPAAAGRLEGPIGSVGIVVREKSPEVVRALDRLTDWLGERSVEATVEGGHDGAAGSGGTGLDTRDGAFDLVIALGGDGTLLRAARSVVGTDTPVLGVNLGRLGFLTSFPDSELEAGLTHVFEGRALLEPRHTLRGSIERAGEVHGDNFFALNDIVVHTSGAARVGPLTLHVGRGADREEVGSFAADGVILATPTGSTAYSMSAGGPIIVPAVACILVTPICPHSLAVRPLVIPADEVLSVTSLDPDTDHQVTVDGQVERGLEASESLVVAREEKPVCLVRLPGQSFFRTMRTKLNWAARPPERA
ncbi:MAG TPA: NAD(+)/NADH kinase [Longimicrobiales bacterium]|nr:NAD(+)/NADH kinase [Longimicrobiales bacterium]